MRKQKGNASVVVIVITTILVGFFIATRSQKGVTQLPLIQLLATTQESDVHSGDGTMKLIMKTERETNGSYTYSFTIAEISGANSKTILTKTASGSANFSIPANSWSPENKEVFIEENAKDEVHFLVLKASGELFANGEQFVDVTPLFTKAQPNLKLKGVTGWDGPDTLHVTTLTPEGGKGPSFWFIVSSHAFLQLAS